MASPTAAPPTPVLVLSEIDGLLDALTRLIPPTHATFLHHTLDDATDEILSAYSVIIADPPTFGARCADSPGCTGGTLRWLQSTYAGVDGLLRSSKNRGYTTTRLAGVFGQPMAEYVMMHMMAQEKGLLVDAQRQQLKEWGARWTMANGALGRTLDQLTIGVMGSTGDIGSRVVQLASAFGMTVWACGRGNGGETAAVSRSFGSNDPEQLSEFLGGCDYVVNVMPSTPDTRGLLTAAVLSACKPGAVLMNIGRGDVFANGEDDVLGALDAGYIRHAVLDVFAPTEPLPQESRLWHHPGVTVTPHNSWAPAQGFPDVFARVFAKNLGLFRAGEPLNHAVDWEKGY